MARSEKRTLSIEARLKNYIKGDLNALERGIGRFALVSVRSFQNLKGALFSVKGAVAGVGVAFGAIKFAQFARETAEQADDLRDLATATGDLVENLSELQAAFKLSGINGDAFEGTVLALAKAQRQALDGNQQVAAGFKDLGITLDELRNLAPAALFEQMSAGLEQYNTEQDKAVALGKVVPKQFLELLPAIGQGVAEFQQNIAEVREVGATLTEEQAASAAAVTEALDKLGIATDAVGRSLLQAFGPEVAGYLEGLARLVAENRDAIADFAKQIGTVVVQAVSLAIDGVIALIAAIDSVPGISLVDDEEQKKLDDINKQLEEALKRNTEAYRRLREQQQTGFAAGTDALQKQVELTAQTVRQIDAQRQAQEKNVNVADRLRNLKKEIADQSAAAADAIRREAEATKQVVQQQASAPANNPEQNGVPALGLPSLSKLADYARQVGTQLSSVFRSTRGQQAPTVSRDDALATQKETLAVQQQIAALRENEQALRNLAVEAEKLQLEEIFNEGKISAEEYAEVLALLNNRQEKLKQLVTGGDFWGGFQEGARESVRQLTDLTAAGKEAGAQLVNSIGDGLTDAFTDIITGTKSAAQAFRDFAITVLQEIARIAAKLLATKIVSSLFGGPAMETGGILPGNVTSTAPVKAFARGGIARRPTMALFGEGDTAEAFVPLPDNRSIPVSFVGGGAQTGTQVSINIQAMDSRDVQRALLEQQSTLRGIFTNTMETRSSFRSAIQRAAS